MKIKELKITRPDVKNQGVPRSKMPQIATKDYPEFLDYLKEKGGDISKKSMSAKDLKPIQKEFSDAGVEKAIAKGKFRNSGNETFFHNGKEFKFEKNDPSLFFLQRIRDEAHRFAISAHRARRKKGISKSLLDQIEGIGSVRKRALLNHFGSARSVESASLEEIKSVEGVEEKVAKKIYNFFHE